MKVNDLTNPIYSSHKTTRRNFEMVNNTLRKRLIYRKKLSKFTGKEQDPETGLYYYGARYLDPKTSRWLSGDPAMGEYFPSPGQEAGKLPGQGGVFNYVNLHAYHYAGNNSVNYTDPDGRNSIWEIDEKNNKIEIIIPVKFLEGTTRDQKRAFLRAVREWNGTYKLPSGFGHRLGNGRRSEKDYRIHFTVIETEDDIYDGIEVNTINFLPETYSEEENRISNVQNDKDMTIYRITGISFTGHVKLLKHEFAHFLGIRDKYDEKYNEKGVRIATPPRFGWENNIAANHYGKVESRNFIEANNRTNVNKRKFKHKES